MEKPDSKVNLYKKGFTNSKIKTSIEKNLIPQNSKYKLIETS